MDLDMKLRAVSDNLAKISLLVCALVLVGMDGKHDPAQQPTDEGVTEATETDQTDSAPVEEEQDHKAQTGLSDLQFHTTVAKWDAPKRCVISALRRHRKAPRKGVVVLELSIENDGTVVKTKVSKATSFLAKSVSPCLTRNAARLHFPSFEGNAEARLAKFVF